MQLQICMNWSLIFDLRQVNTLYVDQNAWANGSRCWHSPKSPTLILIGTENLFLFCVNKKRFYPESCRRRNIEYPGHTKLHVKLPFLYISARLRFWWYNICVNWLFLVNLTWFDLIYVYQNARTKRLKRLGWNVLNLYVWMF